jgi:mono/diheme cytochrome c family protein
MTDQMVGDVMNYLKTLPGNQKAPEIASNCEKPDTKDRKAELACGKVIFEARCAVCHGPEGQGKDGAGTIGDPWHQGMALWHGDVRTLSFDQHLQTVEDGRRFAFMPAFAKAPSQGITLPPFPLSNSQIDAVIKYERTL